MRLILRPSGKNGDLFTDNKKNFSIIILNSLIVSEEAVFVMLKFKWYWCDKGDEVTRKSAKHDHKWLKVKSPRIEIVILLMLLLQCVKFF